MTDRIVICTHNRVACFETAMDALLFSLQDVAIPVTIVLNQPTYLMKYLCDTKYSSFDMLQCDQDDSFDTTNVVLQWYSDIDNIVVVQDNQVLPRQTRMIYYRWPYLFIEKLRDVDIVCFCCSEHKATRTLLNNTPDREDTTFYYYNNIENGKLIPLLQPCALSYNTWRQIYNGNEVVQQYKVAMTKHVATYRTGCCNGVSDYNNTNRHFATTLQQKTLQVTNNKTGETRTIEI